MKIKTKYFIISFFTLSLLIMVCNSSKNLEFLEEKENINDNSYFSANITTAHMEQDENGNFNLKSGFDTNSVASIKYENSYEVDGWDKVTVSSYTGTNNKFNDEDKAYYMGYLEGIFTSDRIWNHMLNMRASEFNETNGVTPDNVIDFFNRNIKFVEDNIALYKADDTYWLHVELYFLQLKGMMSGYNQVASADKQLNFIDFMILDAEGDIEDIPKWQKPKKLPDFKKMSLKEFENYITVKNKCSSLIKVNEDFSEIFFGHDTWSGFSDMIRIFKQYTLITNNESENAKTIAFTSYPGAINSVDDFYLLSSNFYVAETTNPVFSDSLMDKMTPESVLTAARTVISNRLAKSGSDWADIFSRYNSGTYNNQFQILDLNKIDLNSKKVDDDALWIVEQVPGVVESADLTQTLKYGYWPSYNAPYFESIKILSGYPEMEKNLPDGIIMYDYDRCFRANMFRRDQGTIKDLDSFKKVMRLNNYQTDPLSFQNPIYAISARMDLAQDQYSACFGGIDSKVVRAYIDPNTKQMKLDFQMVNGPTTQNQPPFNIIDKCTKVPGQSFVGMPNTFNFDYIKVDLEFAN